MLSTKNYKQFQIVDLSGQILHEFEGATLANKALPGDSVRLKMPEKMVELVNRRENQLLVGVLCLTSKYMYGMTGHGVPIYLCEPMNKGYPSFRVACKEKDRSNNLLITFHFDSWDADSELPRGGLAEILGPVEDPRAEALALALIASPKSAPRPPMLPMITDIKRPKLSTGTFNIDPPGCKDIDDVITLERVDEKIWKIAVTIADVAEMVRPPSPQWTVARTAGATVYQDGAVIRPMLHRHLSEEVCSLLPGKLRYGLALVAFWEQGRLSVPFFQKVLVANQESYTYESIYKSKTVPLDILKCICSEIAGRSILDSHEWIEQLMLWYNRTAAKVLRDMGAGLLRRHDAPFQERRTQVLQISPQLEFLAYKSAEYCAASARDVVHHGLSSDLYCHASSPIRRFADLLNQTVIKRWLDGEPISPDDNFEKVATELNHRQKEIAAHDRHYALLTAIHGAVRLDITGTVLWLDGAKVALWIDEWKTLIRIRVPSDSTYKPGAKIGLRYFCDRRKAQWKEKILYEIIKTVENTSVEAHTTLQK